MIHLSLVDIAARFDHLEPAQVLDGFVRPLNGLTNGVLDGGGRGAGEFDEFIDVVFHIRFFRYSRIPQFRNVRLIPATTGGGGFFDRFFDRFTSFPGTLLDPAKKHIVLAFGALEIVIRELGPPLLQLPFGNVPVAFDFECNYKSS